MPQDLPGFYYDPEKNRYFPAKGPGAARKSGSSQKSVSEPSRVKSILKRGIRTTKLLQDRELYGNIITVRKRKGSFQNEYKKNLASQPVVWKYQGTEKDADAALGLVHVNLETPAGLYGTDVLLAGGVNGSFSLFEVGEVSQHFDYGVKRTARRVWADTLESRADRDEELKQIWRLDRSHLVLPSTVSCISIPRKEADHLDNSTSTASCALITTLGSEAVGGSVYTLDLIGPWDLGSSNPIISKFHEAASLRSTIWSVDCNSTGGKAVIGTNKGVTLLNLETAVPTELFWSRSDVLSLQLIQSENIALCGLRNGAILTVDARQKQRRFGKIHRIPYPSQELCGTSSTKTKGSFKVGGHIFPDHTAFMPSSISSLVSLQLYSQYFLASSMDGSVKLYDHRLTTRGAVQSYEGLMNSHTRIQLGVDPCERFVMSGGEDNYVRIWSIKSGELLYQDKFSNSTLSNVCWEQNERFPGVLMGRQGQSKDQYRRDHCSGAWLGSREGLFQMQF
ncbi:hypothetical protein Ancab_021850 [Ancistrocladus abbreviatus]